MVQEISINPILGFILNFIFDLILPVEFELVVCNLKAENSNIQNEQTKNNRAYIFSHDNKLYNQSNIESNADENGVVSISHELSILGSYLSHEDHTEEPDSYHRYH